MPAARTAVSVRSPRVPRRHRLAQAALAALAASLPATWGLAQGLPAGTLPAGPQLVHGQAQVQTVGAQMRVSNTPGTILDWQSFSIGARAGVHFEQANAASKVLNRVTGPDPSHILGSLTSNGQVWLLNPHGVLFGQGARVDVAGLVASTLRLGDADFMAGRFRFGPADAPGTVRNEGVLSTTFGGQVVLLAERVENLGRIEAEGGGVALAGARSVELVDTGVPRLAVRVEVPAGEVLNLGALAAPGGRVDVHAAIVNQQGLVQAGALGRDATGQIVLRASDTLTLAAGSRTSAEGAAAGGAGGTIQLLGGRIALLDGASVDASAAAGAAGDGGRIYVGGGREGRDPAIPNARAVFVAPAAALAADAGAAGQGGSIVLWSDEATRAYGRFSARGGATAGDGGFVETSGGWLDARPAAMRLEAGPGGAPGRWLLDPNDILINQGGPSVNITGTPNFTTTGDSSVLAAGAIAAALNAGISVTVATGNAGANTQPGDILMNGVALTLTPGQPVSLTLRAARDVVVVNTSLESAGAPLTLNLQAAGSGIGAVEVRDSVFRSAGGDLRLGGQIERTLPLPDGTATGATFRPAVGYEVGNGVPSNTSSNGRRGVDLSGSVIELGGGTLGAVGLTTVDNSDGLRIGRPSDSQTLVTAGRIELRGHAAVAAPQAVDLGVFIVGEETDLTATAGIAIFGAGRAGVEISGGARLRLQAVAGAGSVASIEGFGKDFGGLVLIPEDVDSGSIGRGTQLRVDNGALQLAGRATAGVGMELASFTGSPVSLVDARAATSASFSVPQSAPNQGLNDAIRVTGVDLDLPDAGASSFTGDRRVVLNQALLAGGGSLSFTGLGIGLADSLLATSGAPLALAFATAGANAEGLQIARSAITTGNGDLRFGAVQNVCLPILGCTQTPAPWLVNDSVQGQAALELDNASIDAGSGRVFGGGASPGLAGVVVVDSTLAARAIELAGRSDAGFGVNVSRGTHNATRLLALDGVTAGLGAGTFVARGTSLTMSDPQANAGSALRLAGTNVNTGSTLAGLRIEGGDVGTTQETLIAASGGELRLLGIAAAGGGDRTGLVLTGSSNRPGGLLINGLGATSVRLEGEHSADSGAGLQLQYATLLGPAGGTLELGATGAYPDGTPGLRLRQNTIASAGSVSLLGNGIEMISNSLSSGADVSLLSRNPGGMVYLLSSTVEASGPTSRILIQGADGGPVRGTGGYGGFGVLLEDSTLRADAQGAAGAVLVNGLGAPGTGSGLAVRGTTLSAASLTLVGAASDDGDGVQLELLVSRPTSLNGTNVSILGTGVDADPANGTRAGVRFSEGSGILASGRGTVEIAGSSLVLQSINAQSPVLISGDAAAVNLRSSGSMRLQQARLDFTDGAGTDVVLAADSGAANRGRIRLADVAVDTAGGVFRAGGGDGTGFAYGVYDRDAQGNPLAFNPLVDGPEGLLLTGNVNVQTAGGAIELRGRGATDGRAGATVASGVVAGGSFNRLQGAGTVTLEGHGGDAGRGLQIDGLDIDAVRIDVRATGVGIDGNNLPLQGLATSGAVSWFASDTLVATAFGNGLLFTASSLEAGNLLALRSNTTPNQPTGGEVALLNTSAIVSASGGALRIEGTSGDAVVGTDGARNGTGVTLRGSDLIAPAAGGLVRIAGQGASGGGRGVELLGSPITGATVQVQGSGSVSGHGVYLQQFNNVAQRIDAVDLTVSGVAANSTPTGTQIGVLAEAFTTFGLSSRGSAGFSGDTLLLAGTGQGQVVFTGDPAGLSFSSTGSMRLQQARLDFTDASGPVAIGLTADSDGNGFGRVRMNLVTVDSNGGNITIGGGFNGFASGSLANAQQGNGQVDGINGVFLSGSTLRAGTGSITLAGRGLTDNGAPTPQAFNGVFFQGANTLEAASITFTGRGGNQGHGVQLDESVPGTLQLNASNGITIDGTATGSGFRGIDAVSDPAAPQSQWSAGAGALVLRGTAGGVRLSRIALTGASIDIVDSGAPNTIRLSDGTAQTAGPLRVVSADGGIEIQNYSLRSAAALALAGVGPINVLDTALLQGATVTIGTEPTQPLVIDTALGQLNATGGPLRLRGAVRLVGDLSLNAASRIQIESTRVDLLGLRNGFSPRFAAPDALDLNFSPAADAVIGSAAGSLDAAALGTALAAMPAGATNTLRFGGANLLTLDSPVAADGRLRLLADRIVIGSGGRLTGRRALDAVVVGGASDDFVDSFRNDAGAGALDTPNGRWVLLAQDPAAVVLGGLVPQQRAFALGDVPWLPDNAGNLGSPLPGNALGYAVQADQFAGALTGLLTRVYDATTGLLLDPGSWVVSGLAPGDQLRVSGVTTASMGDKNVGINKPVLLDAGSVFSVVDANGQPVFGYEPPVFGATITPRAVTATGLVAAGKVYDGTVAGTLASFGSVTPLAGDVLAVGGTPLVSFADRNAGIGKSVSASGLQLTGADAANYALANPNVAGLVADIAPAPLAITGLTAQSRVYDATPQATLAGSATVVPFGADTVTVVAAGAAASFADKNVGSAKPVTVSGFTFGGADAGNYVPVQPLGLVADITRATLVVSGLTAQSRVYDAGVNAVLAGTPAIVPLGADAVGLAGTAAGLFADKNVGSNKPLALSGLTLTGPDAGNYTLQLPATLVADITPRPVTATGFVVASKVYDAGTGGTLAVPGSVTGLPGDIVSLAGNPLVSFADKNAGSARPVLVSGLALAGVDAANYQLTNPVVTGLVADITAAPLVVSGLVAQSRVYDATTSAALGGTATITPIAGDAVSLAGTPLARFADKNVGTAKAVTVSGFTLAGADAANYSLLAPTGLAADVTAAPLVITGVTAASKVYDRSTAATLLGTPGVAAFGGDTVTVAGTPVARFADRNAGSGKPVTVSGYTLAGADAANYSVVQPAGLTAAITAAPLQVGPASAAAKVYDGSTAASASAAPLGVIAGDTVTLALAAQFADRNVGAAKAVNFTATLGGADAANYTLPVATGSTTAPITPATLTYVATPLTAVAGSAFVLAGSVSGFVGGDTLANSTSGTLAFTSPGAQPGAGAGTYAVTGTGLTAPNYVFVQSPANAVALTLTPATVNDPATQATAVVFFTAIQSVTLPVVGSSPTQGRVLDVMQALGFGGAADGGGGGTGSAAAGGAGAPGAPGLPPSAQAVAAGANASLIASLASGAAGSGISFRAVNFTQMQRDEIESLLAARAGFKRRIFARQLFRLEQDPSLAEVRGCRTEAELATGNCLLTDSLKAEIRAREQAAAAAANRARRGSPPRRVKTASVPNIERKMALLIGINQYQDKVIPELSGAVPDTRAVSSLLEGRLGYEIVRLENASREQIVRAFNRLALEADGNDSVVIYFAGHGVVIPPEGFTNSAGQTVGASAPGKGAGSGYWLPSDSNSEKAETWLANSDIARMLALIGSRQTLLISDSCYSGSLAGRERVQVDPRTPLPELLARRAAVVMSSGGDEPVADEGRNGHSVFAWHLMQSMQGLQGWQIGASFFDVVRNNVVRDFPQTPQYGAQASAGHQGNTDYLFERREIESAAP